MLGVPFPGLSTEYLAGQLTLSGATVTTISERLVGYAVPVDGLEQILACPALLFTQGVPPRPVAEGFIGRSSTRVSILNAGVGGGYDGDGINIAIGEDGRIQHLDFHGRKVEHLTFDTGSHGEMTAGMAGGAGNIDPSGAGAAPGATLHIFDVNTNQHLDIAPAFAVIGHIYHIYVLW
ncbi:MAG: hypothetical protein R2795_04590 [Saprospiraceae bacterium]